MTETSHRVVVGIDGSDASSAALDWAIGEAVLHGAALEIVHAWSPSFTTSQEGVPRQEDPAAAEARAKEVLAEAVDAASKRATVLPDVIEPTLVRGIPSEELERRSADALELVVGSHGLGAVAGAVLGSVSESCCEHATTTTTVVPHRRTPPPADGPVVAGVDGSAGSRNALRWAAHAAGLRGVPLRIVHLYPSAGAVFSDVARHDVPESARALLGYMVTTIADVEPAPTTVEQLAKPGHRAHALIEAAADASILVVGSRGRTGMWRLLGSFSRACTHHASCPVTVVREPQPHRHP